MKLAVLAKQAAAMPKVEFEWAGAENWHPEVFKTRVTTLPQAIEYIDALRERMQQQSRAIDTLQAAYKQLVDLVLEAEVESV